MSDTPRLLTAEDLAAIIHLSPNTVRAKASRSPDDLPPRVRGLTKLLWSPDVVKEWFLQQSKGEPAPRVVPVVSVEPRLGRPRRVV